MDSNTYQKSFPELLVTNRSASVPVQRGEKVNDSQSFPGHVLKEQLDGVHARDTLPVTIHNVRVPDGSSSYDGQGHFLLDCLQYFLKFFVDQYILYVCMHIHYY